MLADAVNPEPETRNSKRFSFGWNERLHQKRDFSRAIQSGRRYSASGLVLWVHARSESGSTGARMGLAIPKAFGNAVTRNRLKRLLREVFRLNKSKLQAPVDLVFSARPMKSGALRYQTVEPIVIDLWTKAELIPR